MKSLGQKIKQCTGLLGTQDLSAWEGGFLSGIKERTNDGANTTGLSERQVEVIERIYSKHFA